MTALFCMNRRPLSSCRPSRSDVSVRFNGTLCLRPCLAQNASRISIWNMHAKGSIVAATKLPKARLVVMQSVKEDVELAAEVPDKPVEPASPKDIKIKVAANGKVQAIAGKIAHSIREGVLPDVACLGPKCTNVAVKAVAISRGYLAAESKEISFQPVYVELDRMEDEKPLRGLVLKLATTSNGQALASPSVDAIEMHVRATSIPTRSAGALAARVREQRAVFLTAIGAGAVHTAVSVIEKTRKYLKESGKDIRALPEFIKVTKEDRVVNAIKFNIVVEDLPVEEANAPLV
ncbi:hypothetical protein VaNZ11_005790 [Volvox africanus]|uniref:Uncharacterized protein n=1 Tax=Volvox africanus TaxID=51714 RepID=A0ABQ5S0F4_9CHLO|nr:hypothetical protein VaNZ11_005790 [Volvox africanus]